MTARPTPAAVTNDQLLSPFWAEVIDIEAEADGVSTYWLEFDDPAIQEKYQFGPGQFNMLYVPGYGEAAISISSDPSQKGRLGHTIRFVGNVTGAFKRMEVGARVGVRGPFGNQWPLASLKSQDVVLATGGIGLAPLRPVIYSILNNRADYGRVILVYGSRTPRDLLYQGEFDEWEKGGIETLISVDRADENWRGHVGVVPMQFYRLRIEAEKTSVLCCGPEIMMRFVVYEALARRIPQDRIFLSLERNMKCGQGFCGHCQLAPFFVCKDGPVFDYTTLEPFFQVEDL